MAKPLQGGRVPALPNPDAGTLDGIVKALYESVSFSPGTQPDYNRLKALFHESGIIIPPRSDKANAIELLDPDGFITRSRELVVTTGMEREGFYEKEIARRTSLFGAMVHLFSTYETRHTTRDQTPFQRGINSIQLIKDAHRFWIVSIVWDIERAGNPIPRAFLL